MRAVADEDDEDHNAISKKSTASHDTAPEQPNEGPRSEDDEDDDDGEDEPKLKYNRLTGNLGTIYRNGDATSAFLVSGHKMVIGTHNGNIHIFSLPSLQPLRTYRAHSASITAVSVSPLRPVSTTGRPEIVQRNTADVGSPARAPPNTFAATSSPGKSSRQVPLPNTPSNAIHIATASIDGKVCVSSLVDAKDVTLRNFARPVQAVAISPDFKNDRTYLSGGLAGNLIVTVGGKAGVSADANTNSAAAAASGWLGSIGLGSNTGKDTVLHAGEGSIGTIRWSLSGKYVAWVNEQGIKIMRSHYKLDNTDSEFAWKRIAHIDRPNRPTWNEMASVWKARIDWIDDAYLEVEQASSTELQNGAQQGELAKTERNSTSPGKKRKAEKLVVGWGDTAWVIQVQIGGADARKDASEKAAGSASILHKLRFDDCIISGLSLYTPSLLLIIAYRTHDDESRPLPSLEHDTPRRGRQNRQTGIPPEVRLIDVHTKDVVDEDTLSVSRFETLSASDYHLSTLFVPPIPRVTGPAQKGAFEALGGGLWDAGLNATRIFSSGASVKSHTGSSTENGKGSPATSAAGVARDAALFKKPDAHPSISAPGLKIFLQSPYDCVLAVKRDEGDRLEWLLEHQQYKEAWELLDKHPEALTSTTSYASDRGSDSTPSTPAKAQQSLADFFADDSASQSTLSASKAHNSAVEKEKRRIGDLWLQKLVSGQHWADAGRVAGKVLGTSSSWEHWVWTFAEAGRFDEITPHIPRMTMKPPLPSIVYEVVLGHYIAKDRLRLQELLEQWDPELFNVGSVTAAIEAKLQSADIKEDAAKDGSKGRDWRILMESLQRLYLADGRPRDALRCCIKLQNADEAMRLISDFHLLDAVADDIPGLILLRISQSQLDHAPLEELDSLSKDPIQLLVDEAYHGVVKPQTVVSQLSNEDLTLRPFLFFYLRALWRGDGTASLLGSTDNTPTPSGPNIPHPRTRLTKTQRRDQLAAEGHQLIATSFADLAVRLFADYDRPLLLPLLRHAQEGYSYDDATQLCRDRGFVTELVFLLSKTGQTRAALRTIVADLRDVGAAIAFVRESGDGELWGELLECGMERPAFVRGLLEEVGTGFLGRKEGGGKAGDGSEVVRRIPDGLEIEGLKGALGAYLRGFEIQADISAGVARVLRSEVAEVMGRLREGRARGVRFEVRSEDEDDPWPVRVEVEDEGKQGESTEVEQEQTAEEPAKPGHCVRCREPFTVEETKETLIGFACGHVYHLSCILDSSEGSKENVRAAEDLQARFQADVEGTSSRSVGAKVAHAHVIRRAIRHGCSLCLERENVEEL
ncbi:MAG: hypothetical protein Q9165_002363 [Trypethelium subeluteriae]